MPPVREKDRASRGRGDIQEPPALRRVQGKVDEEPPERLVIDGALGEADMGPFTRWSKARRIGRLAIRVLQRIRQVR